MRPDQPDAVRGQGTMPVQELRLVLVGMMGSGKTTVGRLLAARTGWPYTDNDELVRRMSGREPAEIRATDGEDALHILETRALLDALEAPGPVIVGAAGWVVMDDTATLPLREHAHVVWLRARPETLRARIGSGRGRRAEATDIAWLTQRTNERERPYGDRADLVVDVDDAAPADVAEHILARLPVMAA